MVSYETALSILADHGLGPDDATAYDIKTHIDIDGSSFHDEMGRRPSYSVEALKRWLGY